jgi:hypothetical protein
MKNGCSKIRLGTAGRDDHLDLDLYAIIFPKGASGLKILNHHCQLSTVCPAFC